MLLGIQLKNITMHQRSSSSSSLMKYLNCGCHCRKHTVIFFLGGVGGKKEYTLGMTSASRLFKHFPGCIHVLELMVSREQVTI